MKKKMAEYAEKFAPVYTLLTAGRQERELTWEEVQEMLANASTEQQGHAVYGVQEVIVGASRETGWERQLWAYRIGNTWTYVPTIFENIAIHWAE